MRNRGLIFLILLIVIGCASTKADEKKVSIITGPAPPPAFKEKLEELMVSPIEEEIKEPEKLYSLSFREADIHEILTVLARESKLNMVVDYDVTGRITVDLKEVTLIRALDCLLTPLGLQYTRMADIIRVSPVRMQTRMFLLNYLTTKRVGSSATSGTTGGRALRQHEERREDKNTGSFIKVETSDTIDLWKEIEEGLKSISSQQGRLVINKISGSILATDFPQNLARIAEFLETIEGTAQRQVMIEARIIEVALSDEYQMGIDWSSLARIGSAQGTFTQILSPANEVFQISVSDSDFSLFLDAMSKQGRIDILSSPKISALNNQPAIIKVATEDVYWERETESDASGRYTSSTPRWITIGILLGVTPQIGFDGLIIMDIHPSITEKAGESISGEGDIAPILTVRETNTVVKVRDGQTIIIAGLLQKKASNEVTGVPFLEDIPILGYLFKKTVEKKKKTELIITLTPRIMVGNEIENRSIRELSSEWEEVR